MPAFNEHESVIAAVDRVLAQPFVAELIIVDDASTDGTTQMVSAINHAH